MIARRRKILQRLRAWTPPLALGVVPETIANLAGVNVFPSAVADVIASFKPRTTGEFQIRLPASGTRVDPPVPILVECGPEAGDLEELKRAAGDDPDEAHLPR